MRDPIYIAYADDHVVVRQGVTELLHKLDERFKVFIEAENGLELMNDIAHSSRLPDVCIIDISMPVMDGYDTLLNIRKTYPRIKCVAFTLYDNSEHAILQMLANGALGFVAKNARGRELADAIHTVHNGNFYFSKDVLKLFPTLCADNVQQHIDKLPAKKLKQ